MTNKQEALMVLVVLASMAVGFTFGFVVFVVSLNVPIGG